MNNSGKRKYTKKKVMSGGDNIYKLVPFHRNGKENHGNVIEITGETILHFVDLTEASFQETFSNTLIKGSSKCYLVEKDGHYYPYQLIRDDNDRTKVYQYQLTNFNIRRIVKPPISKRSAHFNATGFN